MKIKRVDDFEIVFDDGQEITFDHYQDCCEANYAAFDEIDDLAYEHDFKYLKFEPVECAGFRFGDDELMVFVPCYSSQNGYYSSDININLNGIEVISAMECEMLLDD